jgi:tetratricopeptide (TPR) repeat protein
MRLSGTSLALGALALTLVACASDSDLNILYNRGIKAARKDRWEPAMKDLQQFAAAACNPPRTDRRCREAFLAMGRGYERRGVAAQAWVAYDRALALPPHERDAVVQEDLARARQELLDKQQQATDRGPVVLRYRDEVSDEFSLRSVNISIDFKEVVARDKNAGELHSPDFAPVFGGSLMAGPHVLVVETVHSCMPGQAVKCARSQFRRSWAFESAPKEPTTLEFRAYAEPGEGGAPAQPLVEMRSH